MSGRASRGAGHTVHGGAPAEPGGPSVGRRRFRLRGGAVWGVAAGLFLLLEALLAVGAPLLTGANPLTGNLEHRLLAPGTAGYLLGTDQLGRDVLARMLYGARISLVVGVVAVAVAGTVGVVVGLLIGYRGGWLDRIVSQLVDVQLSFPFMALALSIAAVLGAGLTGIVATLAISSWVLYARLVRGESLSMRRQEFVEAAYALGVPTRRILHPPRAPNVIGPAIALASLEAGRLIVAESSLSFLGYGSSRRFRPGATCSPRARTTWPRPGGSRSCPAWRSHFTCLSTTLLGDWLTEVLDPRRRR